jgi:tetratricopeptide (TPR) repeat protein
MLEFIKIHIVVDVYIFTYTCLHTSSPDVHADVMTKLNAALDWIRSEEGDVASLEVVKGKVDAAEAETKVAFKPFFEAVEADRLEVERQLEEESKKRQEEEAANPEDAERMDNRKLKYPDRLRKVEMNKAEGTELFKGTNWLIASQRYKRALNHCHELNKLDLTGPQREEANKLKTSLHLNMAQCFIKMEKYDDVIFNCNAVLLDLDQESVKALYRRAFAYEKIKDFDTAKKDLTKALHINGDEKNCVALLKRVNVQIKRQQEKEKKMYQSLHSFLSAFFPPLPPPSLSLSPSLPVFSCMTAFHRPFLPSFLRFVLVLPCPALPCPVLT